MVFFLKSKDKRLSKFKYLVEMIEMVTGKKVGKLWSNRGGEFMPKDFDIYLESHGIGRHVSQVWQNDMAIEQRGRTTEHVNCGMGLKYGCRDEVARIPVE